MEYQIVAQLPGPDDYNRLRQAVGWGSYERAVIEAALPCSLYGVCAVLEGQVVGMARVIGDGGLTYYVQDVIILPAYQRQGLGTRLMDAVMAWITTHAHQNSVIGLMAAQGKEPFYQKYGFVARPTERLGCGMTIFWQQEARQEG